MLCHRQHHLIPPGNNMISENRIHPVAAVSIQRRTGRAIPLEEHPEKPTTVLDVSQNPVTDSKTTSPSNWWVMVRFLNHQQYQSPPCWVGYFLATWKTWSWNLSLGETPSLTPFRMPGHRSENKLPQYEATGNLPNMRKTCLVMSSWTRSVLFLLGLWHPSNVRKPSMLGKGCPRWTWVQGEELWQQNPSLVTWNMKCWLL